MGILVPASPAAAGPLPLSAPTLSREGRTLTSTAGAWFPDGNAYAYGWERCDAGADNCATVPGRSANRYLLSTADVGRRVRSVVVATNGLLGPTTARSAPTDAVGASPPLNRTPPTVTAAGSTLTSTLGTWSDPSPDNVSYTQQWQRCSGSDGVDCQDVAGQTGATFTLTAADERRFLRVVVSAEGLGRATVPSTLFGPVPAAPVNAPPGGGGPGGTPDTSDPPQTKPTLLRLRPFPKVIVAGRLIRGRTLVSGLVVRAGPKDSIVTVTCRGRGCPRGGTYRTRLSGSGSLKLKRFQRMYGPGAVIEIRITKAGAIGKFTRLQVRARGIPGRRDACLMPGASKPARCP